MKLYEIAKEYKEVEDLDDMPEEAIRNTLEGIKGEFEQKALAVSYVIENKKYEIDMLKQHKKNIDDRIKRLSSSNDRLRDYLRYNMEKTGINKIACPYFSISLGAPSEAVEVDIESLPYEYKKISYTADKVAIKKAIKAGEDIEGASIVEGKKRLVIKT